MKCQLFFLATLLVAAPTLATPQNQASLTVNNSLGHWPWVKPLEPNLHAAPKTLTYLKQEFAFRGNWIDQDTPRLPLLTSEDPLVYLQERVKNPPATSGDWLYERHHWRLCYQAVLLAEQYTKSPSAKERQKGLQIGLWLVQSPFLNLFAYEMPAQIIDALMLPFLASAPDDTSAVVSRLQLLRVAVDVYDRAERPLDAQRALIAVINTADVKHLNAADGARYQLAFRLKERGYLIQALNLLESIQHDALRPGAQTIAEQWRTDPSL